MRIVYFQFSCPFCLYRLFSFPCWCPLCCDPSIVCPSCLSSIVCFDSVCLASIVKVIMFCFPCCTAFCSWSHFNLWFMLLRLSIIAIAGFEIGMDNPMQHIRNGKARASLGWEGGGGGCEIDKRKHTDCTSFFSSWHPPPKKLVVFHSRMSWPFCFPFAELFPCCCSVRCPFRGVILEGLEGLGAPGLSCE